MAVCRGTPTLAGQVEGQSDKGRREELERKAGTQSVWYRGSQRKECSNRGGGQSCMQSDSEMW